MLLRPIDWTKRRKVVGGVESDDGEEHFTRLAREALRPDALDEARQALAALVTSAPPHVLTS